MSRNDFEAPATSTAICASLRDSYTHFLKDLRQYSRVRPRPDVCCTTPRITRVLAHAGHPPGLAQRSAQQLPATMRSQHGPTSRPHRGLGWETSCSPALPPLPRVAGVAQARCVHRPGAADLRTFRPGRRGGRNLGNGETLPASVVVQRYHGHWCALPGWPLPRIVRVQRDYLGNAIGPIPTPRSRGPGRPTKQKVPHVFNHERCGH